MKRRNFIRTASLATAATLSFPYLLPGGRLFAKTQDVKARHVVLVLFAGGVRQQESVLQRYLSDSQNEDIGGNMLLNLLDGSVPENKIVFGLDGSRKGEIPISPVLSVPLQNQGVLFREMHTSQVGHFGGLNMCLQGTNILTQGLKQQAVYPTIFEYLRRHGGFSASDVWFIGSGTGNSLPLLNYSAHPDYGAQYGANFLAPSVTFGELGSKYLSESQSYHPEFEIKPAHELKQFLDKRFDKQSVDLTGVTNSDEEAHRIQSFIRNLFEKKRRGTLIQPEIRDNNDLQTMGYACEVIAEFKPALTVINLDNADICHSNFTGYLKNLHRADHAVGFLWNYIQTQIPQMSDETILLLLPECGRNLNPNPIRDENDWFAYDHSDENAKRVFGLMAGKNVPEGLSIGNESNPVGLTADIVPTIADILGIGEQVKQASFIHPMAKSLFEHM